MLDAAQAGKMVMPFTTLVDQVRQEILAMGDATEALREIERRFARMHNEAWDRERHIAGLQDRIARAEMEHAEEVKKLKAEIERAETRAKVGEAWKTRAQIADQQITRMAADHARLRKELDEARAARPVIGPQEPSGPKWATLRDPGLKPDPDIVVREPGVGDIRIAPPAPEVDIPALLRRLAALEVRIGGAEDRLGIMAVQVRLIDERLSPVRAGEET
jgi:hypothetical protein